MLGDENMPSSSPERKELEDDIGGHSRVAGLKGEVYGRRRQPLGRAPPLQHGPDILRQRVKHACRGEIYEAMMDASFHPICI